MQEDITDREDEAGHVEEEAGRGIAQDSDAKVHQGQ